MDRFSVLIVDDEDDFVETTVKSLRDQGLNVECVRNDREALRVLNTEAFDVCVLEVMMPGMDGFQALGEIRARRPFMEVIILSRHGSPESGIRGLELGAYDYIMKPVPFPDLLERITRAYERKKIKEGKRPSK